MSLRGLKVLVIGVVAVLLAGCTTIDDLINSRTQVDYKKGYDFDHIEKLAIAPGGYSGDRPVVLNDEQSAQVNEALTLALEKQGMIVVDSMEDADAIVDWHVVTEEKNTVRAYNAQSYYHCWRCGPAISDKSVSTYTQGTFIVDIIDPAISKSVWRGVMQGRLADLDGVEIEQENFNTAAKQMFSRFPPGVLIDGIY